MTEKNAAPIIDLDYIPGILRGISELIFLAQEDHNRNGGQSISNEALSSLSFIIEFLGNETEKGIAELESK